MNHIIKYVFLLYVSTSTSESGTSDARGPPIDCVHFSLHFAYFDICMSFFDGKLIVIDDWNEFATDDWSEDFRTYLISS